MDYVAQWEFLVIILLLLHARIIACEEDKRVLDQFKSYHNSAEIYAKGDAYQAVYFRET